MLWSPASGSGALSSHLLTVTLWAPEYHRGQDNWIPTLWVPAFQEGELSRGRNAPFARLQQDRNGVPGRASPAVRTPASAGPLSTRRGGLTRRAQPHLPRILGRGTGPTSQHPGGAQPHLPAPLGLPWSPQRLPGRVSLGWWQALWMCTQDLDSVPRLWLCLYPGLMVSWQWQRGSLVSTQDASSRFLERIHALHFTDWYPKVNHSSLNLFL